MNCMKMLSGRFLTQPLIRQLISSILSINFKYSFHIKIVKKTLDKVECKRENLEKKKKGMPQNSSTCYYGM